MDRIKENIEIEKQKNRRMSQLKTQTRNKQVDKEQNYEKRRKIKKKASSKICSRFRTIKRNANSIIFFHSRLYNNFRELLFIDKM